MKLYMRQMQIHMIFRGRIVNPKVNRPAANLLWHLNDVLLHCKDSSFPQWSNYSSHLRTLCRLNCFVSFIKSATKSAVSTKKWASTYNKFVAFDVARVSMITSSANWKRDVGSRQARNTCFVVIYCLVFITSQSNLVFLGFISIKRKPWSHLNVVRSRSPNSEIKTLWDSIFTYYLTIHSNFIFFFLKRREAIF